MTEQPKSLLFLHIPKTAGSTLINITSKTHRPESIYTIMKETPLPYFEQLPAEERAKIRLLRGHMAFGQHTNLQAPCRYFTVLREPIDRVISLYYYLMRNTNHPDYAYVMQQNLTLEKMINDPYFVEVDNLQTRLLSGVGFDHPYGEVSPAHVKLAKQHITDWFDVAGLSERFDETLLLLQRAYAWKWIYYASLNVTRKRPQKRDIAPETRALIAEHNQHDIELYAWVKQRFEQTVVDAGPEFVRDLVRFQHRNQTIAPFLRTYWKTRQVMDLGIVRGIWDWLNKST